MGTQQYIKQSPDLTGLPSQWGLSSAHRHNSSSRHHLVCEVSGDKKCSREKWSQQGPKRGSERKEPPTTPNMHTQHRHCGVERWRGWPGRSEDWAYSHILHLHTQAGSRAALHAAPCGILEGLWLTSNQVNWRSTGLSLHSFFYLPALWISSKLKNWTLPLSELNQRVPLCIFLRPRTGVIEEDPWEAEAQHRRNGLAVFGVSTRVGITWFDTSKPQTVLP